MKTSFLPSTESACQVYRKTKSDADFSFDYPGVVHRMFHEVSLLTNISVHNS
jgi:hypothetical protein